MMSSADKLAQQLKMIGTFKKAKSSKTPQL